MSLKDWSTTADSNTSAPPNGWPEGMTIANVNNTGRKMMAVTRNFAAEDTIASATTCDLGTKDATFLTITGTTTITGLGTVSAGIYKFVKFSGALTLTHNATSLILLTGASRTTVAGDCALYKSEGSGNWREYFYSDQGGYQPLDATLTALASSLSAANKIPYATALDTLGELDFKDEDNMASNSATALPSQQSVKAYADNLISSATLATPDTAADYFLFEDATDTTQKKALLSAIVPAKIVAWINFDGTSASIGTGSASHNIDSVTDNGAGSYTLNLTAGAVSDANFAVIGSCRGQSNVDTNSTLFGYGAVSTSAVAVYTKNNANTLVDSTSVSVAIIR